MFGTIGFGNVLVHLLLLMVLSSAAASTQTTILPTARTTLAMGVYKAIPRAFLEVHKRFLTPDVSRPWSWALASIVLYVIMNYISAGTVISDAVSALGVMIAFYYGLTGFSCAWYYRATLSESCPQPVDAGHPARSRAVSCCGRALGLQPVVLLAAGQQLHQMADDLLAPLGHRRASS